MHTGFWWGNLKEDGHLEKAQADDGIILKPILMKVSGKVWQDNEPSASIKSWEFSDQLQ